MTLCLFLMSAIKPGTSPVTVAALYPPAGSIADKPFDNPTSLYMQRSSLGEAYDWIDILPYAPDVSNTHLNLNEVKIFLAANPQYREDWVSRINLRLDVMARAGVTFPVVYIVGATCNENWKKV
jgi:hypothetical protein